MSAFSDYLEAALLNATLRGQAFTPPAQLFMALFTGNPQEDGSGPELVPASFPGYARVEIPADGTGFGAPAPQLDGSTRSSNDVSVEFPVAVADWPDTVRFFGIFDAPTGGNLLYYGAVTPARLLIAGDNIRFPAGSVRISLN